MDPFSDESVVNRPQILRLSRRRAISEAHRGRQFGQKVACPVFIGDDNLGGNTEAGPHFPRAGPGEGVTGGAVDCNQRERRRGMCLEGA